MRKLIKNLAQYAIDLVLVAGAAAVAVGAGLFGISGNWIIDCIVVTIVVVIISMIMSRWSALIIRKLNVRYLCKVEVRK